MRSSSAQMPYLEGVVLTASGDTDPLIVQHRAAQVISPTALQAGVGIRQPGIRLGAPLQPIRLCQNRLFLVIDVLVQPCFHQSSFDPLRNL